MNHSELLRLLYDLEKPILQRNDWAALRVSIADLARAAKALQPALTVQDVEKAVGELRLDGKVLLFPPWEKLGGQRPSGTTRDSRTQWELSDLANLNGQAPPSWRRRKVFLPDELPGWYLRSRTAELTRLLATNRERFGLSPATAHVGYELQARSRPERVLGGISQAVARLVAQVNSGQFSRAKNTKALAEAIDVVGKGLARSTGVDALAGFQERSWASVLESLFDPNASHCATMVTAGVSSGKTNAFALPILTLIVYRALCGDGGANRALVVYPRTSLVLKQARSQARPADNEAAPFWRRAGVRVRARLSARCVGRGAGVLGLLSGPVRRR